MDAITSFLSALADAGLSPAKNIEIKPNTIKPVRYQVKGDKPGSLNGWYIFYDDGIPAGSFGSWKSGMTQNWCARDHKELTPEEKAAYAKRMDDAKRAREEEQQRIWSEAATKAKAIWQVAKEANDNNHPYLERKLVNARGLRVGTWSQTNEDGKEWLRVENALLVPIRDEKREIVSLQAIFPDKNNATGRDKTFLAGGRKSGCYHGFGKPDKDAPKFIIGEGYATMASIHQATGLPCVVAFDSNNLVPVAKVIRKAYPTAQIVIAADDDQWTLQPIKNPGLTKAKEAAALTKSILVKPVFSSLDTEPTDFNDLHVLEGIEAVRNQIEAAIKMREPVEQLKPKPTEAIALEPTPAPQPPAKPANDNNGVNHMPFTVLGYDRDVIYVFPFESKQIRTVSRGDMSETGLLSIAPLEFWEALYPTKSGFDKKNAVNWLFRTAYNRGVFNPDRIRGRGCWRDKDRLVFHFGEKLNVDGEYMPITKISSQFVYQAERPFPRFDEYEPLTADEGADLLGVAMKFRWGVPASALLLMGWVVLAPICGALRWRPHIWITGGPGSGKSTVLEDFVHELMGGLDVYAQGNSTEAGLRQHIRGDAVPVLFDEAEQNTGRETKSMQSVLSLVRQASSESGARTLKGTSSGDGMTFHVRSMFCLASIQVGIQQQADRERLTVLALREKNDKAENEPDRWEEIKQDLYMIKRDSAISKRLLKRTISMIPQVLKTIDVFVHAAAKHFGNQRTGDQYGALLAGAWCAAMDTIPTIEEAQDWINQYDWNDYTNSGVDDVSTQALRALLDARVRTSFGSEYTVYELVDRAAEINGMARNSNGASSIQLTAKDINDVLGRYGMKLSYDMLLVSRNPVSSLDKLMGDTLYHADFKGLLSRIPGVNKSTSTVYIAGSYTRCIGIPMSKIV